MRFMRCRRLVTTTTLVTAPDGRGHICYSNKKCSSKQHPLTRHPREPHPIPWHLKHPIERLPNRDFQNLKIHPHHPRHPRHVYSSRLQFSTPIIPIPPHLRTRLIRSPRLSIHICRWYNGRNSPPTRMLYGFREEYLGELRECAEEVRSDVCERLRAPFFRCHFRFGLEEDGFGERRE